MHFVIMGCGRVGAHLAEVLDSTGHSVAIIDQNPDAFRRLSSDFSGQRVTGNGFDLGTLRKARISEAYAFAAVSNGDNSNVISARAVSEEFGVKHVVARVSDPERASLYERLGIPSIAATKRISTAVLSRILPPNADTVWVHPAGLVSLVAARPVESWYGISFADIEAATHSRISFVSRLAQVLVAHDYFILQEDDELYLAIEGTDHTSLRDILMNPPEGR